MNKGVNRGSGRQGNARRYIVRRWTAGALAALTAIVSGGFTPVASHAVPTTVAGFEMDGDIAASTAKDWSNISVTPYDDKTGNADVTTYNSVDKESAAPATWNLGNNGAAAGKVDIGYHAGYLAKDASTGHWWWFTAWDRATSTGAGGFLVELNQSKLGAIARQTGDVRIVADVTKNNGIVFASARKWTGTAWGSTLPSADFVSATNGAAIPATAPWDTSPVASGGQIDAKLFGEIGVDLTAAGIANEADPCHLTAISSWQLRAATGAATSDGAPKNLSDSDGAPNNLSDSDGAPKNLSDGTDVHPFDGPATCGSMAWTKRADSASGALLGGATFTVHRTHASQSDVNVVDNGANDADPVAGQLRVNDLLPGTYSITETAAPAGYIGTSTAITGQSVSVGQVTSAGSLVNQLGTLEFTKAVTGHPTQLLGGATFTITATSGAAATAPWNLNSSPLVVADNSAEDLNKADGSFRVAGLPTGTYSVVETGRPTGYDLDTHVGYANITSADVTHVFSAQEPAPAAEPYVFLNTPRLATLHIVKSDFFTNAKLAGATFIVCQDAASSTGFDRAVDCAAPQRMGTVTTNALGVAELSGLAFGDYWVMETIPPAGYDIATPDYWAVSITAANDGARITLPITNQPAYGSFNWTKRALTADGVLLGGATFVVHRTDASQPDVTVVDNGANDSDPVAGAFKVDNLHLGHYNITETVLPRGYMYSGLHLGGSIVGGENTYVGVLANVLGSMVWTKVIAGHPETRLGGATFTVTATGGAASDAPWNLDSNPIVVADNGVNDADPSDGGFRITGLPTGEYTVVETGRPTGYNVDPVTGYATVPNYSASPIEVFTSSTPAPGASAYVFADVSRMAGLRVVKSDSLSGALLDAAQFLLCRDSSVSVGFDYSVDCATAQQVASLVTGSAGVGAAQVDGLAFGDYWLWESVAPVGYDVADPRFWQVSVTVANDGALITVPLTNAPAYGSLSWFKRAGSVEGALLGGATFVLHRTDVSQPDVTVVDNGVGDANPVAGALLVSSIHAGTYTVTETVAPAGYFGSAAHTGVVVVAALGNSAGTFVNVLGSLRWSKVIAGHPETRLGGATFTVTATGGAASDAPWNLDSNPIVVADNGVNDADPSDGGFRITGLPSGSYTVVETLRPTGYDLDATTGLANITDPTVTDVYTSSEPAPGASAYVFADVSRTSTLRIEKTDATTGAALDGAVFKVCKNSIATEGFDPAIDCAAGNVVATVVSGVEFPGEAELPNLSFGDYWVYEIAAPMGYNIPAVPQQAFSVTPKLDGADVTVFYTDPQKPMSVQLYKTDAVTQDGLAGATFELSVSNGEGWTLIGTCTTVADDPATTDVSEAGLCDKTFTDLAFGDYQVIETVAPTGYQLPTDPFYFSLGATEAEEGDLLLQVDNNLSPIPLPGIVKSAIPASGSAVLRGDTITYTLSLTNTGTSDAVGDVVDTLPSVVTIADAGTGAVSADGRSITWSGVTVAPGAVMTLSYTVTVNADAPAGTFSNSVVWSVGGKTYPGATTHTVVVSGGGGGGGGGGVLPFTGESGTLPMQVAFGSALVMVALILRRRWRKQ